MSMSAWRNNPLYIETSALMVSKLHINLNIGHHFHFYCLLSMMFLWGIMSDNIDWELISDISSGWTLLLQIKNRTGLVT